MSNNTQSASSGVGLGTIIVVVLFILKVGKVGSFAGLSWWWVFAGWWIPLVIVLAAILLVGFFMACAKAGSSHGAKRSGYGTGRMR